MNLDLQVAIQIVYALGIGMLLGLERSFGTLADRGEVTTFPRLEASTDDDGAGDDGAGDDSAGDDSAGDERLRDVEIEDSTGMRTFSVLALLGFAGAYLGERWPWMVPATLVVAGALVVAMYLRTSQHGIGITTEAAAICATALGMLCRFDRELAAVIGLVLTVLLASKRRLHATVRKVRRVELNDTLKFLVVVLIVLPLLPNRALDPYEAFNPYKVGVLVVLISGISFAGYFLTRFLGAQKGLGLTGVIGGLTSSTAVTAAMAQQAKEQPSLRAICAFSTVAANATMFARVLVVVALLDRPLFWRLLWSVGGMALTALIASVVLWFSAGKEQKRAGDEERKELSLKNPFSLGPAFKFAAFFVFILFLLKLAKMYFGDSGLYLASAVSGLADVDAITLSVSEQVNGGQMAGNVGAIAITIAVVSNSVTKAGIAISTGGWKFGRLVALALGAATVVGLVVAFVQ